MTDEQIIKLLKKMKNKCKEKTMCEHCELYNELYGERENDTKCLIYDLLKNLVRVPAIWNIEEIERIIKQ